MSSDHNPSSWFSSEVDPEHVIGRGFEVTVDSDAVRLVDPDVEPPSPLVIRSAWGYASRTLRAHWPYDFRPTAYSGVQLWEGRKLALPRAFEATFASETAYIGRGVYASLDEAPPLSDVLEFVFIPKVHLSELPDEVLMTQILLDLAPAGDPFVVAASRILEPLIGALRSALAETIESDEEMMSDLRSAVEVLVTDVRALSKQPSKLRAVVQSSLAIVTSIVTTIVASRVDAQVNRVDWPTLLHAIMEATRHLGLG